MTSVYPFNAYINGSTKQNKIPFHHLNGQINNDAPLFPSTGNPTNARCEICVNERGFAN